MIVAVEEIVTSIATNSAIALATFGTVPAPTRIQRVFPIKTLQIVTTIECKNVFPAVEKVEAQTP